MAEFKANDCPFCRIPEERVIDGDQHTFVVADAFPVSPGHTLVIPRRHIADFFELTDAELLSAKALLNGARKRLMDALRPDGFNVGVNVGGAAGQTIYHVHVHLIPRFVGDVASPDGGVRNVIPGRGSYQPETGEERNE